MAIRGFLAATYPAVPDPLGANNTDYTVMCWVYYTERSVAQPIFGRGSYGGSTQYTYQTSGVINISETPPGGGALNSGFIELVGSWNHIAVIRQPVNPTRILVINGEVFATQDNTVLYTGAHDRLLSFGRIPLTSTTSARFGTYFDARVYGVAKSVEFVRNVYFSRGKDSAPDSLVRWFVGDGQEGVSMTGTYIMDHSPNGNHGEVLGTNLTAAPDPFGTVRPHTGGF